MVDHSKSLESTMGIIRLILGKLILLFNWLFTAREELLTGGGDLKVHCLRISDGERGYQWMYESSDIVRYLEERFIAPSGIAAA